MKNVLMLACMLTLGSVALAQSQSASSEASTEKSKAATTETKAGCADSKASCAKGAEGGHACCAPGTSQSGKSGRKSSTTASASPKAVRNDGMAK